MPRWIEFHDSSLAKVSATPNAVVLHLRAYVHEWELVADRWKGTGWTQPVILVLEGANLSSPLTVPANLSDGWLLAGDALHENLVPLPFVCATRSQVRLETDEAQVIEIEGTGMRLEVDGVAVFVEDLARDLLPFDA